MTANEKDLGSDALRSDLDNADQARQGLKKHAERGIAEAKKEDPDEPSDDHPEQDPAEGAREVIDRDLARDNEVSGDQQVLKPPNRLREIAPDSGECGKRRHKQLV